MEWVAVDGTEGESGRAAYDVALDPYAEPRPALVCRNAAGRVLKKVPAPVRKSDEADLLQALADWLAEHAAHARSQAERWMTRSLPLPARLLHAVWPDPYWQRVLRHAVVAPYRPDGSADVARAGLLVRAGGDPVRGLRVVSPEGELYLEEPLVTIPHPVLLDPEGRGQLERWRSLLDAYGGEQGVEQLHRTVWWRPRAAPATRHDWRGVDAFDGADFDSGARFERAVSRFGGRIRGETAHFDVYAGRTRHAMRIDLRWQGPMSGTLMNDVYWGARGTARQGAGAYDDIPLVAWSEGMRTVAHLYDARDGGYRQEDRPDASTAYQRFLARCAENADGEGSGVGDSTAPGAWEDSELLDAGGIAPGTEPDAAAGEDALVVCRYGWAGLEEGARIVRLVPRRAAGAEDAVARVLGLVPLAESGSGQEESGPGDAGRRDDTGREVAGREVAGREVAGREVVGREVVGREVAGREVAGREVAGREVVGREVVGRVRSAPAGFLARVCRAEPADARRAIGLLKQLRACGVTAATKPGRAAKGLEAAVTPLEKQSPGLVTAALEEGARIVADAGSPAMAQPLFARAREVENRSGALIDEDALIESFVDCAAAGAVSKRALADHRDALVARLPAPGAARCYRRLVLSWHRAGLPSRPEFAPVLLDFAGGTAPVDEEHRVLLRGLLSHGGMDEATMDVWDGWAPVLTALLRDGTVGPEELLHATAAPTGGGRAALAEAAAGWVRLLRETGAAALLTATGEPAPAGTGEAGAAVDAEDLCAWLDRFARRYRGLRPPVDGLHELLTGIGARLRAEGAVFRALPVLRLPDTQASARDRWLDLGLLDALLAAGVPVREDAAEPLGFVNWLGRAKGDDLPHVLRDDRFAPRLTAELAHPSVCLSLSPRPPHPLVQDPGRVRTLMAGPALRAFAVGRLREHGRRAAAGGVLPLHTALRDLEPFAVPAARRHVAVETEHLLAIEPAVALARTLRDGIPDEWGWPGDGDQWHRGDWAEIRDGGDALLLVGAGRAVAVDGSGLRTRWQDETYDHRKPWQTGLRWEDGAFVTVPFDGADRVRSPAEPAARETVLFPGDDRPRTVHRAVHRVGGTAQEFGELRGPGGDVVAAWALTGRGVFGRRNGRWVAGSPFAPPPGWWHLLRPRDEEGSARLRTVDTATAEELLAAVGPETRTSVRELRGARSGARVVHETTQRVWSELGEAIRRVLPEVTHEHVVDGLAGVLWSAVECRELAARPRGA
ncbi:DUF4132 domain-containing protein [Streptomyces sp. WAC05374]|uniref:DUF4132 domain-containing protein n=1 Tax=Streptomyces sp. WAC05374 TaxID=2487420 RepID=UPI001356909B|nr:DUF4132 domain-containing protein [Streptomyces sp. WAC05374]